MLHQKRFGINMYNFKEVISKYHMQCWFQKCLIGWWFLHIQSLLYIQLSVSIIWIARNTLQLDFYDAHFCIITVCITVLTFPLFIFQKVSWSNRKEEHQVCMICRLPLTYCYQLRRIEALNVYMYWPPIILRISMQQSWKLKN